MKIGTVEHLRGLVTARPTDSRQARGQIILELSGISPVEQQIWQRRINSHFHYCGCPEGTVALLISTTVYAALLWARHPRWSGVAWPELVFGVVLLVTSLIVGKAIGRWLARMKLARAVDELSSLLEDPSRLSPTENRRFSRIR
jgi:hypothetical protein